MSNPPLRMRVALMATMTHRVMIPFLCRRGFSNPGGRTIGPVGTARRSVHRLTRSR
jgi:hypothetical protein